MSLLFMSYRALSQQVTFFLRLAEVTNAGHDPNVMNVFPQKCDGYLEGRTRGVSEVVSTQFAVDMLYDMLQVSTSAEQERAQC